MTEKKYLSELCMNCLNADDCGYRINQNKPIIFCEEFICTGPSGSENDTISIAPEYESSLNSSLRGICSNCENFETCTLPKPEGDVMNCEEYR